MSQWIHYNWSYCTFLGTFLGKKLRRKWTHFKFQSDVHLNPWCPCYRYFWPTFWSIGVINEPMNPTITRYPEFSHFTKRIHGSKGAPHITNRTFLGHLNFLSCIVNFSFILKCMERANSGHNESLGIFWLFWIHWRTIYPFYAWTGFGHKGYSYNTILLCRYSPIWIQKDHTLPPNVAW